MIIIYRMNCQRLCLLLSVEEISSLNSSSDITLKKSLYARSFISKLSKFGPETSTRPATIKLQLFFLNTLNKSSKDSPGDKYDSSRILTAVS